LDIKKTFEIGLNLSTTFMYLSVENLDCMLGLHSGTMSRTLTTRKRIIKDWLYSDASRYWSYVYAIVKTDYCAPIEKEHNSWRCSRKKNTTMLDQLHYCAAHIKNIFHDMLLICG
jgi:hypothetical protein